MKRLELVACEAVETELIEGLEKAIVGLEYTYQARVEGKGRRTRKEGSQVWPELKFLLVSYLRESDVEKAESVIADVRRRFPKEGIFAGTTDGEFLGGG